MQKPYSDPIHGSDDFESSEIDLRSYIRVIRKRWIIVATFFIIVVLFTIVATYTAQPFYSSFSQVLIEKNRGKSGLESNYSYYDPYFLDTQAAIIKSENVAFKVVENLQLAKKYKRYFFEEKAEGTTIIGLVKDQLKTVLKTVTVFFKSSKDKPVQRFENSTITFKPMTEDEIIARMIQGGLNVIPVKNTKIVSIIYENKDPAIAKLVVDAVVKAYMDEMLDIKLSTSNYSLKWMTVKAAEERDKLEKSERELQQFMRDNDLVTVENRLTILPQKLSEFGRQLSTAEAERKELEDLLKQVRATKNNPDALEKLPVFASKEVLINIRERSYKASKNIFELSKKYGKKHPLMIRAKDELRILNEEKQFEINRIVSTIENSYELAVSKQKSLRELLGTTKAETLNLNEKFMQYSIMKREVDSNRVLYNTLQSGIKKQGVTEQSQNVNIWVIKNATLSAVPSKPNKKRNILLSVVLGLFGGVGLAFFIEYLDNTLNSARQIEERYGLTVLGSIEQVNGKEVNIDTHVVRKPMSPLAESYRLIRTALLLSSAEQPPKLMLITSMNKSEGKTATVVNLSRMLAQGQKKVLIIDCDLRRPRLHSLFDVSNNTGLSSFLSGNTDKCNIVKIQGEQVSLIPSGPVPPDPSELLGSRKMKLLLDDMTEKYDFIVIDSPPIGAVTDSLTLSQLVEGLILVVKAGSTTMEMFEGGVKILQDINARILGVVLNGVRAHNKSYYQFGYSTYYAKDEDV